MESQVILVLKAGTVEIKTGVHVLDECSCTYNALGLRFWIVNTAVCISNGIVR